MSTSVGPRDGMDARIRARRAVVRAEAVKRRQRRTVSLFFLLLLAAAVAVALRSSLFEISDIEVRGASGRRGEAVRQAAGISRGQHLLTAPLDEARAAVEQLPWVRTAVVERKPPSTVAIEVTPRRPVVTVRTPAASWKVDADAVVVDGGRVDDAPVIDVEAAELAPVGEAIADATVRDAVSIHRRLPEWLRAQVVAYRVDASGDLWLRLKVPRDGGASGDKAEQKQKQKRKRRKAARVDVRFGGSDDLELKAEVLRVLLPQAVEQGGDLDVRAPANPVVVAPQQAASGSG